ncbi:MAG: MATE family efflux transporter [Clostridia bacterium]|nr:MATE family efflux transporter [Clostridia bacterium]
MRIQLSDHFTYRKLLRFTLPSIGTMIFTSIYGVVDGFFVSNFAGKTPFAAVNLIMPALMILSTVGFMFGTGGSAIVAHCLGQKDREKANRLFSLFVYTSFAIGIFFSILGLLFVRPVSIFLGAEGVLLEDCVLYGRILLISLPFFVLQLLFQSFFVTAERPNLGLASTVISGLTNMVLDAVLVILLPQPLKLTGAAVASAASQIIGGIFPLFYFGRKNSSLIRLQRPSFDGKALWKACTNGSSELMSNVSMSLVGILYNWQLIRYAGENGIAAYGVMMYVSMIFASVFIGYSIGAAPIISFHDGSGNSSECKALLKKSLCLILLFSVGMTLFAELLASPLSLLFVGYDPDLLSLTVRGFRIFSFSFLFMGLAIFGSGFFTALNDGLTSALISFLRTLIFQVLAVLTLPLLFKIDGVWFSIIVAEGAAAALTAVFLKAKQKKYRY